MVVVRPVTPKRWDDFARLFSSTGCPHYCWCTPYRENNNQDLTKAQRRAAMRRRILGGTPVGVLAYAEDGAVAWCSVAPRETYVKLARSKTMPRVDDAPTWTILCFFVKRSERGTGVTHELLDGAVDYAFRKGAEVVEAYPFDSAGISSQHRGHSSVFRQGGFRQDGRRWAKKRSKSGAKKETAKPTARKR